MPAPASRYVPKLPPAVVQEYQPFHLDEPGWWLILGDTHLPYHDVRTIELAIATAKKHRAVGVLLNGDIADCVTPETRVLTSDLRWVPAGDLKVGDELVGFDEESAERKSNGRRKARKLQRCIVESNRVAQREILALHMDDGTVLRCSPGHRWLGWTSQKNNKLVEWLTAEQIEERVNRGRPVLIAKAVSPWIEERDYDAGLLSGAFDGEGSICFHTRVNNFGHLCFTQRPNAFLDRVEAAIHRKGFRTYRQHHEERGTTQLQILGGMWSQAEFLGRIELPRFRDKWVAAAPVDGYSLEVTNRPRVLRVERQGIGDVVVLQTSSKTYLAEGFCSHNCHELSTFDRDPRAPRYVEERQAVMGFLAYLRYRLPKSRIIYKVGNHEERLDRYLMRHAPALFGLEALGMPQLFALRDHGIEYVGDRRVIHLGKLAVIHGHEFRPQVSTPVNPARGVFLRARTSVLTSHWHQTSEHNAPTIGGKAQAAWSIGCACQLHPPYMPLNNWGNGWAMVELAKDGGFAVRNCRVIGGEVV